MFVKYINCIPVSRQNNSLIGWGLFFWLKEVHSKISILLETTREILFSLKGFEKMLFTIWNFTQGDLHSTKGIQKSFLVDYISTGGIQISFLGGNNSIGGIQISFLGGYN